MVGPEELPAPDTIPDEPYGVIRVTPLGQARAPSDLTSDSANAQHQPRAKRVGCMLKLGGPNENARLRAQGDSMQVIPLNLLRAAQQLLLVVLGTYEPAGQCVGSPRGQE